MNRPLRIAQLALHTPLLATPGTHKVGGMNVYVRELARQLDARGTQVDIFTRRARGDEPGVVMLDENTRVIHLNDAVIDQGSEETDEYFAALAGAIASFAAEDRAVYDVIHSHYWVSGAVGTLLSARWDVPHFVMFHTLGEVKNRARGAEREPAHRIRRERRIVEDADRIICPSEHEAEMLQRLYSATPARISIIPCGVDLKHFQPGDREASRALLGFGDEPIVLYVGRIEPLKGIDLLISAFAQVEADGASAPPPRLLIVGGDEHAGDDYDSLLALVQQLGIGDRVDFRGAVAQADLAAYYSAADVCVVPSFYESWGMVAIEAMATSTPVVASRVGGLAANIRDGVTGYLVPWRCPEPFAERISLLIANDYLRRALGRSARRSVESLGWDRVADRMLQAYAQAQDERTRRAS